MSARTCRGVELSPRYTDVIMRRWQLAAGFVADSPLEGAGLEPSVPLEVLPVGIRPLSSPRTFPRFPPENEVRSGLSAGGKRIRTVGPSRKTSRSFRPEREVPQ